METLQPQTVIGMDIGKKYSHCEAVDAQSGEVMKAQKLSNDPEGFQAFVEDLPRPIRLVMEATRNWSYLYESWEELVDEIQMAHPLKTKAIASARIKTDRIDAGILAHLGRADLVPQAYTPVREVRDLREVLRHRAFLVGLQTKIKNRIHSYLAKLGLDGEETDLFGKAGLTWLKGLELREPYRSLLDQDLRVMETVRQEIKQATQEIETLAEEDPRAEWIRPIRGIGPYSAMLILAEVGEVGRFPDPKKLVSFAGLCPSTHQSGGVCYHGRLTKQGSKWLRWILVEAAQHYAKAPGRLGNFYRRLSRRKGSKVARVALARELLVAIYHCLKKGVAFQEYPSREGKDRSQHAPTLAGRS
jgi:transposase